jgi:hypothetical protein
MKRVFGILCMCGCLCGMSSVAVAESGPSVKLSALKETLSTTPRKYTPMLNLADKTCSTTCGTTKYSATCKDNQECACDCNSGCKCK